MLKVQNREDSVRLEYSMEWVYLYKINIPHVCIFHSKNNNIVYKQCIIQCRAWTYGLCLESVCRRVDCVQFILVGYIGIVEQLVVYCIRHDADRT